ncbi:GNAT family N-acetyltransferase [Maribacter sp. 2307UL18-2]|uniref:GNAT family N-acetyltransferase n=1 Tax=Maribacter sp. 2307UL18-2 TaxID=3386274 RepID=UPI0039BC5AC8
MENTIDIRQATIHDLNALEKVGDALFDYSIKRDRAIEFLNDSRHHLFLALDGSKVVGMASGVHYVHPDKDPSLFINEVSVLEEYQKQGIGKILVKEIWTYAKTLGCKDAWVGTETSNTAAQKCYMGAGGVPDDDPFILFEFSE